MTEEQLTLAMSPASARAARAFVVDVLTGSPARECIDVASLLTSELVTNALLHARSAVQVRVRVGASSVRVEVHDDADRLPSLMAEPGHAFAGRGLHIVDALAGSWGADPGPAGGKAVWFELPYGRVG